VKAKVYPCFFPQLLGKCQGKTRKDGARPARFLIFMLFSVLFVCKCVLDYCHRVATQLQLTNLSYHIVSYIISVYDMKAYRGEELWLHSLSTSAVAESEWSSSHPGRFNPRRQRRFPLSSWIEWSHNWTGCSGKEKYPLLYRDSNPDRLLQS